MVDGKEEDKMKLLKEIRVWILIIMVLGSLALILPNPWASGVAVKNVNTNSPFYGEITPGEKIASINEQKIETAEDFMVFSNYTGMMRVFHNGALTLKEVENGPGFIVEDAKKSNLNFGMDLVGGTRVLLTPDYPEGMNETEKQEIMNRLISTLETRMNVYGLKEIKFQQVRDVEGNYYVQVEIAGATREEIDSLLSGQGNFEAFIPRVFDYNESLEIGNSTFNIKKVGDGIEVDNNFLEINDTAVLDDITVELWNMTNESGVLGARVFEGDDIKHVYFDSQHSYVRNLGNYWDFAFQILISDDGANRFAKVTEDVPVDVDSKTGERYLESPIILFLDDKEVSSLRISASLAGKAHSNPQITGGGETKEEALKEQRRLQSILESGALPIELSIVKVDMISPSLGTRFLVSAGVAGLFAVLGVIIIVFLRYRTIKVVFPILLTSMSEIIIILGAASLIKWTIDMAAIAGIIAAVGTGVDHQIIITDEVSLEKKKTYSLKEKVKRAFFIIFGSAATTVAAMLPLMFVGIGVMRGFAITTVIGIFVGIFITRPAYGKIIERFELV